MPAGSSLRTYILARLLLSLPMLLILLTVVFIILRAIPGDPISALYGGRAPPEVIEEARRELGLDRPMIIQYFDYLSRIFRGDFGESIKYSGQSVSFRILSVFPATLELTILGMAFAILVGIVTGTIAGAKRDTPADVGLRLYGIVIYVIPIFWLGLMFQLVFSIWLGWLPPNTRFGGLHFPRHVTGLYTIDSLLEGDLSKFVDAVRHLILPVITLGLVISGIFTRMVRVNMLQTMMSDYVEAARARGVKERIVVYRHAFKNALVPVVTVMGLQFAILFAGAVLTETTFSWPGMGTRLLSAIEERDFPVVQGIIVFYALLIVLASLVIDVVNAFIDPRIRY